MIIVNVRVPALEKVYNLSIEEKAPIDDLIDEIALLIHQKEGLSFAENPRTAFSCLTLCSVDTKAQLRRESTLANYGICDGAELILV